MTVHVTLQLTERQKNRLEEIAEIKSIDLAALLERSAEYLLQEDAAWIAAVEEGRASAASEELIDHEDVVAAFEARFAAREAAQG